MDRENPQKSIRKSLNLLLPHQIIEEEILPRLPVKSLFRFRCVSKSWCSLIDSKAFIKIHLQNSSRNTAFPYHRLITNLHYGLRVRQCSLDWILDGSINQTLIDDPNINELKGLQIVGCVNGLVCILEKSCDACFVFWNPSTRNFKKLPQLHDEASSCDICNRGFGWDESSDDYKVFAVVNVLSSVIGKVYSSKTNSWKTVELVHLSRSYKKGMFAGGKLHWVNDDERIIVCFDLKTEVWEKMELPYESGSDFCSVVGVIGGCLSSVKFSKTSGAFGSATSKAAAEVWVMKESWSKLVALSHVQELAQRPLWAAHAVGGRDGEVLLFFGMFILVYDPRHNQFRRPWPFQDCVYQEIICVESLIWPQIP